MKVKKSHQSPVTSHQFQKCSCRACSALGKASLATTLGFLLILSPAMASGDRVAAVVNGSAITEREVKETLSGEDFSTALNYLIEEKLILQKAKEDGLKAEEKEVEKKFKKIEGEFDDYKEFSKKLNEEGLTPFRLKEKIRNGLLTEEVIRKEVSSRVMVTPKEISDYYIKNKEEIENRLLKVWLRQALFSSEKEAEDFYQKIYPVKKENGVEEKRVNFIESSTDIGLVELTSLSPIIQETLKGMKEGELSKPIRIRDNWVIIQLVSYQKMNIGLKDVSEKIYSFLYNQKFQTGYKEFIDYLKEKSTIEIR